MDRSIPFGRHNVAIVLGCIGIALSWLSGDTSGLIAVTAPLYALVGRQSGWFAIGLCILALVALLLLIDAAGALGYSALLGVSSFVAALFAVRSIIQRCENEASDRQVDREARLIVESMPGLGWSTDANGNFIYVSPSVIDYVGKQTEEFNRTGRTGLEAVHPNDAERVTRAWLHSLRTGEPFETEHRIRRFDGTYRWFHALGRPVLDGSGRPTGWYGTTIDIEKRKQAEETAAKSKQQLQEIIDTMPALAWTTNAAGEASYFSKRTLDYVGFSSEELFKEPFAAMHPEDIPAFKEVWAQSVASGKSFSFTYRLRRFDGEYRRHVGRAEPLRNEAGSIVEWIGANIDINEWHEAEEALRTRELQLSLLVDTIPTMVWCMTSEGEPSYLNRKLMDYVGLTLNDLEAPDGTRLTGAIESVVFPEDRAIVRANLEQSFRTGNPFSMKYRQVRADGVYRWVDGRAEPLRDTDGRIIQWYGVTIDVDDETRMHETLRLAQERLARATQAASLSELSASIAHEVNQPLAAVVTNSEAALRWLSSEPANVERTKATLDWIIRDATEAAEVVSRIRALFRQSPQTQTMVRINEVIGEVLRLMQAEISGKGIRMDVELFPDLPPIAADRVQIQQVLVNLIRNGIDAIEATNGARKLLQVRTQMDEENNMVCVEVRDHGCGIKEPERIFEAFYTTKETGMGMGLAICRSIIEAHNGRLWAEPAESIGSVLKFCLPMSSGGLE
ncbi:PAS domain-containing protein [Microvirga sp. Mcv34]|uniref:PAS domain-containing protein n=1 Tax=Microvirga sp. Mcv34 TaxID=2926016 RepID=UPI0021C62391|nr:PAS domain-containing protein [Microvirga sp. Mcv34]